MSPVVSTKPYMLRALYEWCADQGLTPYISVQVDAQTLVPRQFVRDGQIVLNLGADAVQNLHMGNDLITCQARFGGVAQSLSIPIGNVAAIYARENGQGMAFEVGEQVRSACRPGRRVRPKALNPRPRHPPPVTPHPRSSRVLPSAQGTSLPCAP
ncbi:MAG: ClpXP protease specificity-enhancing factor [Rhodocyclaceae bacterium]|nr:ClpXP protease specificity-enhancing factor [Rhodocyclaceae bacterium]